MGHPGYPPPRLPKPPIASTDLWVSSGALIVTVAFGVVAATMGLFSLAFLDYCPPESCSAEGATMAVGIALLTALAIRGRRIAGDGGPAVPAQARMAVCGRNS